MFAPCQIQIILALHAYDFSFSDMLHLALYIVLAILPTIPGYLHTISGP